MCCLYLFHSQIHCRYCAAGNGGDGGGKNIIYIVLIVIIKMTMLMMINNNMAINEVNDNRNDDYKVVISDR